jgi:hypothetical protein
VADLAWCRLVSADAHVDRLLGADDGCDELT